MSPTIKRINKYRFFFNSREELRKHIHIATSDGVAKYWIEPEITLADFYNLSDKELREILDYVIEYREEFINEWNRHFSM
ncbi:MAG: DUF4160 domain-containing protein [Bacteroidota bacterium]|nr:DUF4160 domain-containing protein [Bacteroidota bacterium]